MSQKAGTIVSTNRMRNSSSRIYSKYQAEELMSILLDKKAIFARAIVLFVWFCWTLSYLSSQPWQGLTWNATPARN